MSYDDFIELESVKKLFKEVNDLRREIAIHDDKIHTLKQRKMDLYQKIGELAEEYEAEPFFNNAS